MNRESAYEILSRRAVPATEPAAGLTQSRAEQEPEERGKLGELLWGTKRRQGLVESMAKQTARTIGSQIGRQILRGVLGGIFGGGRRR